MSSSHQMSDAVRSTVPAFDTRVVSLARTGRFVVVRHLDGLEVVDALGTAPRLRLAIDALVDFVCIGPALWVLTETGVQRYALEGGTLVGRSVAVVGTNARLVRALGADAKSALVVGEAGAMLLCERNGELEAIGLGNDASLRHACPVSDVRIASVHAGVFRVTDVDAGDVGRAKIPRTGAILDVGTLFDGRAMTVLARRGKADALLVFRPNGALIHEVAVPTVGLLAIAERKGVCILQTASRRLLAVDLRYGRSLRVTDPPFELAGIEVDANAKFVVLAGFLEGQESLHVRHVPYTDVFGGRATAGGLGQTEILGTGDIRASRLSTRVAVAAVAAERGGQPEQAAMMPVTGTLHLSTPPSRTDAALAADDGLDSAHDRSAGPPEVIEIPEVLPLALGQRPEPAICDHPGDAVPYDDPRAHFADLLELAVARAARAIADAWDSGRLGLPANDTHPFGHEVNALVGGRVAAAPDELEAAERRLAERSESVGLRTRASLASGMSLPYVDITRDFELSSLSAQILLLVAAPAMLGEVARLYGVLANDELRPICDRHLVQTLLAGRDRSLAMEIERELAEESPLIRSGLVTIAPSTDDQVLFAALSVDPALVHRLMGAPGAGAGPGAITELRSSERTLSQLVVPEDVKRDALLALAQAPLDGSFARVVMRGRPGSGRRTFLATLAGLVGRPLAVIDAERLPLSGKPLAQRLQIELRRARLRGAVPCISGLSEFDSERGGTQHVREALRSHPGPITFRVSPEFTPPLEPGYLSLTLPPLNETQRLEHWRTCLDEYGVSTMGIERLVGRFRIGPGTIETVARAVSGRLAAEPVPAEHVHATIDSLARQHITARLGKLATRVTRLATWDQVVLPEDVLESVREFVGRANHRRTVYEQWGFDGKMTTSRGLTALFHGLPGTGKSMVAGVIARELNLDLYRVDLSRITSKWIGETEKNLAQVFDAADQGQVVVLFDEADSLFAKRTEVKSSVDRYANLKVNYLLQRFDSFEGVAILTTNLSGALDSAFKRRLSLRLAFPLPDEETRVRLWAAHLPPDVPTRGDFDFEVIAKRFPISGGYIRNSVLRAAFLAAQEQVPLSQEHLVRAIHLEYREMGKLAPGGRLE